MDWTKLSAAITAISGGVLSILGMTNNISDPTAQSVTTIIGVTLSIVGTIFASFSGPKQK